MKWHELKIWPDEFQAVADGIKRFEYRRNDRDFQTGDRLQLREWDPDKYEYTRREIDAAVTYILKTGFGLPEGFCIMSINVIEYRENGGPVR